MWSVTQHHRMFKKHIQYELQFALYDIRGWSLRRWLANEEDENWYV